MLVVAAGQRDDAESGGGGTVRVGPPAARSALGPCQNGAAISKPTAWGAGAVVNDSSLPLDQ
jgi:hypothetical protein